MPQSSAPGLSLKNSNPEERTLKNYKESDYALNKYGVYHEQAVQEQRTCRRNISIDQVPEVEFAVVPDFSQNLMGEPDEGKKALNAANKLLHSGMLTEVQQRRFMLHYFKGLSTRQIAMLEGVRQQTVWESLMWAGKKLRKLFATEKLDK